MSPICCGVPAYLNVISPTLSFFYCKECRKEVVETPSLPPSAPDEYEGWPVLALKDWGRTIKFPPGDIFISDYTIDEKGRFTVRNKGDA